MRGDTDYLVIGSGATGLAFVDTLIAETDAEVTVIDRSDAPGGHWLQAYPFVRLHSLAYYGVTRRSARIASTWPARTPGTTNGRRATRYARTSPRRPRGSPRLAESACSRATSTWAVGATVNRSET